MAATSNPQTFGSSPSKDDNPGSETRWQFWKVRRFNCSMNESPKKQLKEDYSSELSDQHEVRLGDLVTSETDLNSRLEDYKANSLHADKFQSYGFFKEGILPKFEDKENFYGGRLYFRTNRMLSDSEVDECWKRLCTSLFQQNVCTVEEIANYSDKICGAKINWNAFQGNIHPYYKFQVWTKIPIQKAHVKLVGDSIGSSLGVSFVKPNLPVYEWHCHRRCYIQLQEIGLLKTPGIAFCEHCKRCR